MRVQKDWIYHTYALLPAVILRPLLPTDKNLRVGDKVFMGDYGVRIRNYAAASILEVEQGVRDNYDFAEAMLTQSLFLDFLLAKGLRVSKRDSTRQIIGVTFEYGTRSYEEELNHLNQLIAERGETEKLVYLRQKCEECKKNYEHYSPAEVREKFYVEGFNINYGNETISYKMLYRSSAKAKKGLCMFVDKRLYDKAHDFLWMGIKLPKKNAPVVEISAYAALVTSTIVDKIQINPDDVLILEDVKSFFNTNVVSVEIDDFNHCIAKYVNDYSVSNEMFDGQALIDSSIFPKWADGYILLRQHFTKCAAFCTDIQLFFKDYFGDEYDTKSIRDMFGNEHKVSEIKLITTNNAVKWIKFKMPYEQWRDRVLQNGGFWGIVKSSHESKLGDAQRMSYQMVNALTEEIMDEVMNPSIEYVTRLKTDLPTYLDFLKRNTNFANDYDVLIALYEQDHSFVKSTYWQNRKNAIINAYINDLKNGKLRQEADNCTIVGSPYAMLLHAVGESVEKDYTFGQEPGTIQCYSERFADGEYLAAFRSPFNSENNMGYLHNVYSPAMTRYFKLGKLCIAVNMNRTDFQARMNGSDQDSDSVYLTNQKAIVEHAKQCYIDYPTVVNNIPAQKKQNDNDYKVYAEIDTKLASAQLAIGESSNLAQLALTYKHSFGDQKYKDFACILAVIAQVAIDSCKRSFDIDISSEIGRLRKEMEISENLFPEFWTVTSMRGIKKQFKNNHLRQKQIRKVRDKINPALHCPMNKVYDIKIPRIKENINLNGMQDYFVKSPIDNNIKISKHVENLISKYGLSLYTMRSSGQLQDSENYILYRDDFDALIEDIRKCILPTKYLGIFSWLIDRAFVITPPLIKNRNKLITGLSRNRPLLLKCLYEVNPEALLKCFSKNVSTKKQ